MAGEPLDRNFALGSLQQLSCFAHNFQLVVGDGLKEVKCLSQAISKVKRQRRGSGMLFIALLFETVVVVYRKEN